jgi:hypothetical protein
MEVTTNWNKMWRIFIEFKKAQLPTDEILAYIRQTLKPYGNLFILNTSPTPWHQWKRMPNKKMQQIFYQKWSWSAWSGQMHPIGDYQSAGSPIGNRSSPGLIAYSWASDNTSFFTRTRGPLKIKDQIGRITHKDVGPNKQHMNSPIVTLR